MIKTTFLVTLLFSTLAFGSAPRRLQKTQKINLIKKFKKVYKDKSELRKFRSEVLSLGGKAVPVLTQVIKSGNYPDKSRWVATFLLGQIAGVKSAPFISKFTGHPNWVLRLASLKTLLALKQRKYSDVYARGLKDPSMLIRLQSLENIRRLDIKENASNVWAMLYDKQNYAGGKKGQKRTQVIKSVIKAVGDLKFIKAKEPLLSMIQKKKYRDIFGELDYALVRITGKDSPSGAKVVKKIFWKKYAISQKRI